MSQELPREFAGHVTALPPGHVLETYRVERVLGEGGFGITYLARDVGSGKRVAIKELLPKDFATRTHGSQVVPHAAHTAEAFAWALDSFMNEAKTLAELSHPNVVQIHRLFQAHGTAYMVMDYVDGQSMKQWLKGLPGPPTEGQLRAILMPLLEGLEHVHEAGLLHRDIKPDNIFITTKGRPVLLDFGSARVNTGRTRTMTSLVSTGYSPFELYQTNVRQTPATDFYSLGAVIVHAMSGRPPASAIDRMVDDAHGSMPDDLGSRYQQGFLNSVRVAFSIHAKDRHQSVADWKAMLDGETTPEPRHKPVPDDRPVPGKREIPSQASAPRPSPPPVEAVRTPRMALRAEGAIEWNFQKVMCALTWALAIFSALGSAALDMWNEGAAGLLLMALFAAPLVSLSVWRQERPAAVKLIMGISAATGISLLVALLMEVDLEPYQRGVLSQRWALVVIHVVGSLFICGGWRRVLSGFGKEKPMEGG